MLVFMRQEPFGGILILRPPVFGNPAAYRESAKKIGGQFFKILP